MSDRSVSTFHRREGGFRSQVMETMIQQAQGIDPDIFAIMDERDNTLIEEEILHGAGSSKYVYSFPIAGSGTVSGISVIGARELAAHYGGIQHSLIGSISKTGSLFVMKSYPHDGQRMGLFVQSIPELIGEQDYYEVVAEVRSIKTGNSLHVERKEFRLERRSQDLLRTNPNLPEYFERPHYQTIAGSKAYRNGVLALIPQHVQLAWKEEMLKLRKTDVITESVLDQKRSGVLRYAAAKAIPVDRRALETLTMDQIMGLSDAVKEGRVEQFVKSAEAVGIIVDNEQQDRKPMVAVSRAASNGAAPPTAQAETGKQQPTTAAPTQVRFEHLAADEFGDPVVEDGSEKPLQFATPVAFAEWFMGFYASSDNPQALVENNADALAAAQLDPSAKSVLDTILAPPKTVEDKGPKPVVLEKINGRPYWSKYEADCRAELERIVSNDDLNAWEQRNEPATAGKAKAVTIKAMIAAQRAQINKPAETATSTTAASKTLEQDTIDANDVIKRYESVEFQAQFDDVLTNPAVRATVNRLMARNEKTLKPAIIAAQEAAQQRMRDKIQAAIVQQKQQDEPMDEVPWDNTDEPGDD